MSITQHQIESNKKNEVYKIKIRQQHSTNTVLLGAQVGGESLDIGRLIL